jgi:predicted metal-binding membrane protein
MKINRPNTPETIQRGLFTAHGLFRLVFATGAVLVVAGTLMLVVAFFLSGLVHAAATMQWVATATLVAGGCTLVGAGLFFSSDDERDARGKPVQ